MSTTATDAGAGPPTGPVDVVEGDPAAEAARVRTPRVRLQVVGAVYAALGAVLLVLGSRAPAEDITLGFGVGPDAPSAVLDPPGVLLGVGAVFVLAGSAGLLERWTGRLASAGLLVATVLAVPLSIVLALTWSTTSKSTNLVPLLVESLRLGTPIALGAMAGLWSERSGVVNIGIEGMMLAAAGVGFMTYALLGADGGWPLWVGVLVAVVVGGIMALLHAWLSVTFRTDQIISGVVLNLLALGLTSYLRAQVIVPSGVGNAPTLQAVQLPLLHRIPVVGEPLFTGRPIFFAMFVVIALTAVALFRTPWGLRVRSVGENPRAAETLGLDVVRLRYQAVVVGGMIAGLAGAWFSLETVGSFEDGMTNGAGFIALAAMIFGKWRPWPSFGGAMLFGFANALGTRVQFLSVEVGSFPVPSQFLQVLPYVVTIVVLAGAIGKAVPPAADGQPYERSR